mgnify:CR=1 FL=1
MIIVDKEVTVYAVRYLGIDEADGVVGIFEDDSDILSNADAVSSNLYFDEFEEVFKVRDSFDNTLVVDKGDYLIWFPLVKKWSVLPESEMDGIFYKAVPFTSESDNPPTRFTPPIMKGEN